MKPTAPAAPRVTRRARVLALLVLALTVGCERDRLDWPARAPGERRGGVLRLAAPEDVPTLDPALGYDTRSWFFEQHLFETLVAYDERAVLVPGLAERWEVSPDARRYRFTLRRDLVFSDGTPLTATDVVGSLERVLDPRTRSQGAEYFRGIVGAEEFVRGEASHVVGLRAPDARAVDIELAASDPLFLHKLALLFAAVVPAERARRLGDDFTTQPLGSGPFVLREWRRGERIVLARNPRYRDPERPYLDGIVQQLGVNPELSWLMFESGELDVTGIPPADFPAVMRDPEQAALTIHATALETMFVGLNCEMPPLDDPRVRQALNYAVNKADVIALLNGRGVEARGIVPPNMPGYRVELAGYPFDREKARALLAEAGFAAGFATEIWTQGTDTDLKIAQKLQQDFAKVGVQLAIKSVAWASFLDAIRQPKTVPVLDLGWSADFPDPSNFLDVLFHSGGANNHAFYADPAVDRLLEEARTVLDETARFGLDAEAERLIVAAAPLIFLYHPITYVMHDRRVHGYAIHPFLPARVTDVWLDPE
ncbi:MAG: ABC transporter substrate-binding protein [Deltaproteobacteria bacterium]|nr:ABC transporter substrate-binding protein [Deltaproteobacteria bacterium]